MVFAYEDYRTYMDDWRTARKEARRSFSYQEFANRAGIRSKSFLRRVCKGNGHLSGAAAMRVSEAMGHGRKEGEYFRVLVDLTNARSLTEKSLHLEKLTKIHEPSRGMLLSVQQYDLFTKWYLIPIWELVTFVDFKDDWMALGNLLRPPIGGSEARQAVELLLDLGLIERKDELFIQTNKSLGTREELRSRAIKAYQAATMVLAIEALERFPTKDRNIGTVTLGLDELSWGKLQDLIRNFREDLVVLALGVTKVDRMYQCNLQTFPLTAVVERK